MPKSYANLKSPILKSLFQSPIIALLSHWFFQGLLYMDNTERFFKLGIDLLGCLIMVPIFTILFRMNFLLTLMLSLFIIHTLNFLFNGQVWGVLKKYGLVHITWLQYEQYVKNLAERVNKEHSIIKALVYGSVSRKEWNESSDLDIRIIRKTGLWHGVRVCSFLLCERSRALFKRFPIDAYVLDNTKSLSKLSIDEEGINLIGMFL